MPEMCKCGSFPDELNLCGDSTPLGTGTTWKHCNVNEGLANTAFANEIYSTFFFRFRFFSCCSRVLGTVISQLLLGAVQCS